MKYFAIFDKNIATIFQLQWKIGNISDMFLRYSVLCGLVLIFIFIINNFRNISVHRRVNKYVVIWKQYFLIFLIKYFPNNFPKVTMAIFPRYKRYSKKHAWQCSNISEEYYCNVYSVMLLKYYIRHAFERTSQDCSTVSTISLIASKIFWKYCHISIECFLNFYAI